MGDVPPELAMGPRVDVWAPAALDGRYAMVSARVAWRDALAVWADDGGLTWVEASSRVTHRRPYWPEAAG